MPFLNDGQCHAIGISNEKNIVKFMNQNPQNPINEKLSADNGSLIKLWKHEGGTKQKMDASFQLESGNIIGVSIKNHELGTFDWVNTTKGVPEDLKHIIKDFRDKNMGVDIPQKGGIREEVDDIFSTYLDNLSSSDIVELLSIIRKDAENTKYIIINNKKNKELIMVDELNLDAYCNPEHDHHFILKCKNAKTSRQIFIKKHNGDEINTNLRIRLHLNNGITALLGKSTKNKSSVPCLKIQQDNVNEFISNCYDKVIVSYANSPY
jgi:hypothetical protein